MMFEVILSLLNGGRVSWTAPADSRLVAAVVLFGGAVISFDEQLDDQTIGGLDAAEEKFVLYWPSFPSNFPFSYPQLDIQVDKGTVVYLASVSSAAFAHLFFQLIPIPRGIE